jgi:DNA-binding transcriptional MerR regulator
MPGTGPARRNPPNPLIPAVLYCLPMTAKLYKAAEVCDMAQLQPYMLRSWEKEFPGIGIQKSSDSPRLYRQSDLDQVLRIKQLVFGEGLTLAGARRRLEEMAPVVESAADAGEMDTLPSEARTRIAQVKQGLRSILAMLDGSRAPVAVVGEEYELKPPPARTPRPEVANGARATAAVGGRKVKRATA